MRNVRMNLAPFFAAPTGISSQMANAPAAPRSESPKNRFITGMGAPVFEPVFNQQVYTSATGQKQRKCANVLIPVAGLPGLHLAGSIYQTQPAGASSAFAKFTWSGARGQSAIVLDREDTAAANEMAMYQDYVAALYAKDAAAGKIAQQTVVSKGAALEGITL